jgi:hypothetical protein
MMGGKHPYLSVEVECGNEPPMFKYSDMLSDVGDSDNILAKKTDLCGFLGVFGLILDGKFPPQCK